MAILAHSLVNLRHEIDLRWPNRDRRTDGWYRPFGVGDPSDHWPDSRGIVHAIDIDRDGVNPLWVIEHMYHSRAVVHYVIWDRRVWSTDVGWNGHLYTGSNPHTDHFHVSIYHSATAENYNGPWGIRPGAEAVGSAPPEETQWGAADPRAEMTLTGGHITGAGKDATSYAVLIRDLRLL